MGWFQVPLKGEHKNHVILFQDTENMPKKTKSCVSDMKWMTDENDLSDENNQMPGQYRETSQKEKED